MIRLARAKLLQYIIKIIYTVKTRQSEKKWNINFIDRKRKGTARNMKWHSELIEKLIPMHELAHLFADRIRILHVLFCVINWSSRLRSLMRALTNLWHEEKPHSIDWLSKKEKKKLSEIMEKSSLNWKNKKNTANTKQFQANGIIKMIIWICCMISCIHYENVLLS